MKPDFIGFHLLCVTFASVCYAQSGYQYPRPTGQPAFKPPIEQSQGQNSVSRPPNRGSNKPSQNQPPSQSSSNGYQYNRPVISFTTASPQPQTVGLPTSQRSYPLLHADSSTARNTFRNENTFPMTDGGYTPSGFDTNFNGYSSRPSQSPGQNAISPSAMLPTFPESNGSGTTSSPTGYRGGTGMGTFGSEFQRSSTSLGPNPGSGFSSSSFNSGGAGSLGQSSDFLGNVSPGNPSSFNPDSANGFGPSSTPAGNIRFGTPPGYNVGNANNASPSSSFVGNTGSGSSSNFNSAAGGNGPGNDVDDGDFSAIPGIPNADYPILTQIPQTMFSCAAQKYPGYYADVEARCQVFHICSNGLKYDFLCPNGTIFSQMHFVCVWWNQFDCSQSESLYYLNENLYKTPSSPQGMSASFNGASEAQQSAQGAANNFVPSAAPQEFRSQGNEPQEFQPQGPSNNFGPFTSSQMTSANFDLPSNTQTPSNQQPSALYGSPSHGAQGTPSDSGPPTSSSYVPPAFSSQNNHQTSYASSGSSQLTSSSGPFLMETAPPEYSTFLQATTTQPMSYQIGVNAPLNTYVSSSETPYQNYPSTESPNSPFLLNQEMKPSREYLPPFRKRR